jgi:hypothetical protein
LPEQIIGQSKQLAGANSCPEQTVARSKQLAGASATKKKSSITTTLGVIVIKLFSFIADEEAK